VEGYMAKYKTTDVAAGQGLFMDVCLKEQLLPGTFEHMLDNLLGTKIDIRVFDKNYTNDLTGASAIPPASLLKLIFYGYYQGRKSSRGIWDLCRHNIIAKALTVDMEIHWTTIGNFISSNSKDFEEIFVRVLAYANELGLIGGETFAEDGLRLPSNASMDMSGTKEELGKRVEVYRKMAAKHLARHLDADAQGEVDEEAKKRFEARQKLLSRKIENLTCFLDSMEEKPGKHVEEVKSNVTDNESAMIHSSKGFLQGYIGISVTDSKNQIIVAAEAVGTANEGEHFPGLLDQTLENLDKASVKEPAEGKAQTFLADSNYFSEENFQACQERGVEAIIPDGDRKRRTGPDGRKRYDAYDFAYHAEGDYYECPQGKKLACKGTTKFKGSERRIYQASLTDCKACPDFSRCMWTRKKCDGINQGRKLIKTENREEAALCRQMRKKMETEECQKKYSRRIQIAEPVFANIGYCRGLNRFMLRGLKKVNGQWLLYCMVHNLGKCLHGYNARGCTA
jgi:transposase